MGKIIVSKIHVGPSLVIQFGQFNYKYKFVPCSYFYVVTHIHVLNIRALRIQIIN